MQGCRVDDHVRFKACGRDHGSFMKEMRAIILTTKATLFDVEQQSVVYARVRRKSKELFERLS